MLGEIDDIIVDVANNSQKLADDAKATAEKLAEEERVRRVARHIEMMVTKRLEFRPRACLKRNNSFKGRDRESLFPNVEQQMEFEERIT